MEKIVVLALLLVNVQLAVANCSSESAAACANSYGVCVESAGNSTDTLCTCYGSYLLCLYDNACFNSSEYNTIVQNCADSGCTTEQCLGGFNTPVVESPISSTPVAGPTCNITLLEQVCIGGYYACAGNGTQEEVCNCYGPYLYCAYSADCLTDGQYQEAVQWCEQYGCNSQQCTVTSGPSTPPVDAPASACSTDAATTCANEYSTCAITAGTNASDICSCYGPYFDCLYDAQCLTSEQYWSLINTCATSGCTYQQCIGNSTVTPPVSAPIGNTPVSAPVSGYNSTCNVEVCNDAFQSCLAEKNSTCDCYGPYLSCLYTGGCLDNLQYNDAVDYCVAYGCTYQQCTNQANPTPVSAPVASYPVGVTPSTPSAPSAPTTVICLHPWELVLIIVGSVLAGIGLAAIVGVIIYCSRRSTTKRTKYAKLQNY
jgi:hypothetical protein